MQIEVGRQSTCHGPFVGAHTFKVDVDTVWTIGHEGLKAALRDRRCRYQRAGNECKLRFDAPTYLHVIAKGGTGHADIEPIAPQPEELH